MPEKRMYLFWIYQYYEQYCVPINKCDVFFNQAGCIFVRKVCYLNKEQEFPAAGGKLKNRESMPPSGKRKKRESIPPSEMMKRL